MRAAIHPDSKQGLADFDMLIGLHVAAILRNALHTVLFAIAGGRFAKLPTKSPEASVHRYYRAATRFSSAFALAADLVLLTLGGALKRKERISARLADVLIHLYLISALLKRFEDRNSPRDELPLLQWGCETCLHEIQESFMELFENLPARPAAWLLRLSIFPLGRAFHRPTDRLCSRIAGILMAPTKLRDRLSEGIFIPADPADPFRRLEDALLKTASAEPVEQKLRQAIREGKLEKQADDHLVEAGVIKGIISEHEAEIAQQAAFARWKVIQVDDFSSL
jgi:acyl-CoA dehydrogenase